MDFSNVWLHFKSCSLLALSIVCVVLIFVFYSITRRLDTIESKNDDALLKCSAKREEYRPSYGRSAAMSRHNNNNNIDDGFDRVDTSDRLSRIAAAKKESAVSPSDYK